MAWIQIGTRKINTALVTFAEQEGELLRVHFQGGGNGVELQPDQAKALWRFLKAEDIMMVRDKGSATVLPRMQTAKMIDLPAKTEGAAAPALAAAASPAARPSNGGHSSHTSHSSHSSHSSSHSSHPKHMEPHKHHQHTEHKKHEARSH